MNSQQDTPPVTVSSVILTSPNNWDEWIEVIKSKANNNRLWEYVDPSTPKTELPVLKEPIRASLKEANKRGKTKLLEPYKDKRKMLYILWLNYKDNLQLYRK